MYQRCQGEMYIVVFCGNVVHNIIRDELILYMNKYMYV